MEIRAEKDLKVLTYFNPVGLEPQLSSHRVMGVETPWDGGFSHRN